MLRRLVLFPDILCCSLGVKGSIVLGTICFITFCAIVKILKTMANQILKAIGCLPEYNCTILLLPLQCSTKAPGTEIIQAPLSQMSMGFILIRMAIYLHERTTDIHRHEDGCFNSCSSPFALTGLA